MQLIIWGLPSKIAALQLEWAFQKPGISRHLKRSDDPNSTGREAIFPRPKGRRLSPPAQQILVLRALLKSEPFCHWGLRITFFAEWAWKAWHRLHKAELAQLTNLKARRTDRTLPSPAISPSVRCDFRGVDGQKRTLLDLNKPERDQLGLKQSEPPPPKRQAATKHKSPSHAWPEQLPVSASAKGMGVTWDDLEQETPVLPSLHRSDTDATTEPVWSPKTMADDVDFSHLSILRLRNALDSQGVRPLELCEAESSPTASCTLCHEPIDLQEPMSYSVCPSRYDALTPCKVASLDNQGQPSSSIPIGNCTSITHLRCLADHWLEEERKAGNNGSVGQLLPLCGTCPSCQDEERQGLWVDVARAAHRRKEWLDRLQTTVEVIKAVDEEFDIADEDIYSVRRRIPQRRRRGLNGKKALNQDDVIESGESDGMLDEDNAEDGGSRLLASLSNLTKTSPSKRKGKAKAAEGASPTKTARKSPVKKRATSRTASASPQKKRARSSPSKTASPRKSKTTLTKEQIRIIEEEVAAYEARCSSDDDVPLAVSTAQSRPRPKAKAATQTSSQQHANPPSADKVREVIDLT